MEKIAYSIRDLVEGGVGSRTTLYDAIAAGTLKARKRGRSTIILPPDLAEYLESLPDFHEQAAT